MDAINYMTGFQNPMTSFNQALSMGQAMAPAVQQPAVAQQDLVQTPEQQAAAAAANARLMQPGATYDDYMKASMYLPKDAAKSMQDAAKGMAEAEAAAILSDSGQVFAAFRSGRKDIALDLMRKKAEAERAAGNVKGADFTLSMVKAAEESDDGAAAVERMVGYSLVTLPGGKDVFDAIGRLEGELRTQTEHPTLLKQREAEMRKASSDAEKAAIEAKYAERIQQADLAKKQADATKVELENARAGMVELGEDARTEMNNAVDKAVEHDLVAAKSFNLAEAFMASRPATGWTGAAFEAWKKASGGQDAMTALKQQYANLRNLETIKNLPAGPASDKDVEIALQAFPDPNANPDQIAGFLRGMAKLHAYNSAVEYAKASWISQNGSLGPARTVFTAGGTTTKPGMTFKEFTKGIPIPNVASGGFVLGTGGKSTVPATVPETVDF